MKQWYSHLVQVESIIIELDKLDLSPEERLHLAHLVDSSLHHTILDAILSELQSEDKVRFIEHLSEDNHDKIWQFLNDKIEDIEIKITKAADALKKELEKDLKEAKRLK